MRRRISSQSGTVYADVLAARSARMTDYAQRLGSDWRPKSWPEGEPIEVFVWQLPDRGGGIGLDVNAAVLVHADNRIEVITSEHGRGRADVVHLDERRRAPRVAT